MGTALLREVAVLDWKGCLLYSQHLNARSPAGGRSGGLGSVAFGGDSDDSML